MAGRQLYTVLIMRGEQEVIMDTDSDRDPGNGHAREVFQNIKLWCVCLDYL